MKAMSENGMTGFELAEGDWKLTMKREKKVVAAAQTPVVMQIIASDRAGLRKVPGRMHP